MTFCLSKALGAPVGSVLCGDEAFIARARRVRKSLGGGMRQAGVIAAAGIVALDEMVDRLAEDHANAKTLAIGLANIPGLKIDPERIKTNIVYFRVSKPGLDAQALVARLRENGVRVLPTAADQMRAVLNYHVDAKDVERALTVFSRVLKSV